MKTSMKIRANQKGFTLVELIVVVAILGVLAAVAVPNYMNYLYKSRVSTDVDTARAVLNSARTMYMTDGDLTKITLANVLSDADLTSAKSASSSSDILTLFGSINTSDKDNFEITFTPGDKAGNYTSQMKVTERGDLPTPSR